MIYKVILFLSLILVVPFSYAVTDVEITPEQCREASNQIIIISEEALPNAQDKKKAEKLIKKIKKWNKRLKSNEDACKVYQDILKSSLSL